MPSELTRSAAQPSIILHAYRRAVESLDGAAFAAVVTGIAMMEAKESIPHGAFESWLQSECSEISIRTARRWMSIAQLCLHQIAVKQLSKSATVADLTAGDRTIAETLLLEDAQLPPLARALKAKISEMVAGQSRRAIELQAAELKTPRAPVGRRPSIPDRRTPDQVREEARALFLAAWETRIGEVEAMFADGLPSDITAADGARIVAKLSTLTAWVTRLVRVLASDAPLDTDTPVADIEQACGNDLSTAPHIDV